jgi:magnesium transporter
MRQRSWAATAENRMHDETANRPEATPTDQTPADLARPIREALEAGNGLGARDLALGLSAPDLADVIELLTPEARIQLIRVLGDAFPADVLSELDETVRDQLLRDLPKGLLARAVAELDTDDAA